jgi:hypothetical protein
VNEETLADAEAAARDALDGCAAAREDDEEADLDWRCDPGQSNVGGAIFVALLICMILLSDSDESGLNFASARHPCFFSRFITCVL